MITCWKRVGRDRDVIALEAEARGRVLRVERHRNERAWHWLVLSQSRRELASGVTLERERAEMAAEDEAYRAHAPVGDVVAFWSD